MHVQQEQMIILLLVHLYLYFFPVREDYYDPIPRFGPKIQPRTLPQKPERPRVYETKRLEKIVIHNY